MPINYDQLNIVVDEVQKYPYAKLQIVTKNRDLKDINDLINLGYYFFGENKVQEAQKKFTTIDYKDLITHLIGPLQTNKVKLALSLFNTIQTIDRKKLVDEIVKEQNKLTSKTKSFYIQINIGKEPQKSGISPDDFESFYYYCLEKKLNVVGLMCIPPAFKEPDPYFENMCNLRNRYNSQLKLSMGMSTDYKKALEFGSNLVRIGSKIFY